MPRDMFGDVIDPSVKVSLERAYTIPLSIVVHTGILLALIIIPADGGQMLPTPLDDERSFVAAAPPRRRRRPPRRARRKRRCLKLLPVDERHAAPVEAPRGNTTRNRLERGGGRTPSAELRAVWPRRDRRYRRRSRSCAAAAPAAASTTGSGSRRRQTSGHRRRQKTSGPFTRPLPSPPASRASSSSRPRSAQTDACRRRRCSGRSHCLTLRRSMPEIGCSRRPARRADRRPSHGDREFHPAVSRRAFVHILMSVLSSY